MKKLTIITLIAMGVLYQQEAVAVTCYQTHLAVCYLGGTNSSTSCAPGSGSATVVDTTGFKMDCVLTSPGEPGWDKTENFAGTCAFTRITTDCDGVRTVVPMMTPITECRIPNNANSCLNGGSSD